MSTQSINTSDLALTHCDEYGRRPTVQPLPYQLVSKKTVTTVVDKNTGNSYYCRQKYRKTVTTVDKNTGNSYRVLATVDKNTIYHMPARQYFSFRFWQTSFSGSHHFQAGKYTARYEYTNQLHNP